MSTEPAVPTLSVDLVEPESQGTRADGSLRAHWHRALIDVAALVTHQGRAVVIEGINYSLDEAVVHLRDLASAVAWVRSTELPEAPPESEPELTPLDRVLAGPHTALHTYVDDGHREAHSAAPECHVCNPEPRLAHGSDGRPTTTVVYEHDWFDDFGL